MYIKTCEEKLIMSTKLHFHTKQPSSLNLGETWLNIQQIKSLQFLAFGAIFERFGNYRMGRCFVPDCNNEAFD